MSQTCLPSNTCESQQNILGLMEKSPPCASLLVSGTKQNCMTINGKGIFDKTTCFTMIRLPTSLQVTLTDHQSAGGKQCQRHTNDPAQQLSGWTIKIQTPLPGTIQSDLQIHNQLTRATSRKSLCNMIKLSWQSSIYDNQDVVRMLLMCSIDLLELPAFDTCDSFCHILFFPGTTDILTTIWQLTGLRTDSDKMKKWSRRWTIMPLTGQIVIWTAELQG
jgi:hypothetical protein